MNYVVEDVSDFTDARLMFARRGRPQGGLIHTTDGRNSLAYLQGGVLLEGRKACTDLLVARADHIYRLTSPGLAAFHAGVTRWKGKVDRNNQASNDLVGIEFENYDRDGEVPTEFQYNVAALILLELAHVQAWSPIQVFAHSGIAYPGGRRSDPSNFDWGYLMHLMAHGAGHTLSGLGAF